MRSKELCEIVVYMKDSVMHFDNVENMVSNNNFLSILQQGDKVTAVNMSNIIYYEAIPKG